MALSFHKLLQTLNSGSSIGSAAVAILASYGADAHVYLPGIGALNGYTLGNYLESTGNTEATVDNPVGLVLDAGTDVGAEIIVNGDNEAALMTPYSLTRLTGAQDASTFAGGTKSGKFTADGTTGTHYVGLGFISATANVVISGFARLEAGGFANIRVVDQGDGSLSTIVVTTTDTWVPFSIYRAAKGASWVLSIGSISSETATGKSIWLDNLSVKEVPGIHVSQGTTANKPILRKPSNNYYWEFDGVNDSLDAVAAPFQQTDDQCLVIGASKATLSPERYPVAVGRAASATPLAAMPVFLASGAISAYWRDDAGTLVNVSSGSTYLANTPLVVSTRKIGNDKVCRVNGVAGSTNSAVIGTTATFDKVSICSYSGGFFNGNLYPVIAIKGTVSDDNLLILERWVGSLTGPTGVVIP